MKRRQGQKGRPAKQTKQKESDPPRWTSCLPLDLRQLLITKLRPGQRRELVELEEFKNVIQQTPVPHGGRWLEGLICASLEGDILTLERHLKVKRKHWEWAGVVAALVGRLETTKWLDFHAECPSVVSSDIRMPNKVFYVLSENWNNTLPSVTFCTSIPAAAAFTAQLHILEWAQEHQLEGFSLYLFLIAARGGHVKVLQWLYDHGYRLDDFTGYCEAAAAGTSNSHLAALVWLREHGAQWGDKVCVDAAANGNLELIKWAVENGAPVNWQLMFFAGLHGQLDVLKWGRARGYAWSEYTCGIAARNGDLEYLKWLRAEDCPWDERCCNEAARNGCLSVLIWARENGCPWRADVCYHATEGRLERSSVGFTSTDVLALVPVTHRANMLKKIDLFPVWRNA